MMLLPVACSSVGAPETGDSGEITGVTAGSQTSSPEPTGGGSTSGANQGESASASEPATMAIPLATSRAVPGP